MMVIWKKDLHECLESFTQDKVYMSRIISAALWIQNYGDFEVLTISSFLLAFAGGSCKERIKCELEHHKQEYIYLLQFYNSVCLHKILPVIDHKPTSVDYYHCLVNYLF